MAPSKEHSNLVYYRSNNQPILASFDLRHHRYDTAKPEWILMARVTHSYEKPMKSDLFSGLWAHTRLLYDLNKENFLLNYHRQKPKARLENPTKIICPIMNTIDNTGPPGLGAYRHESFVRGTIQSCRLAWDAPRDPSSRVVSPKSSKKVRSIQANDDTDLEDGASEKKEQ